MIYSRCLIALPLFLAALLLQSCSPHPGAGSWVPTESSNAPFSEISVSFNGQVELFIPQQEGHVSRCFWAGVSSDTLNFDCISAHDETVKPQYSFKIAKNGVAQLFEATTLLGEYQRSKDQSRHTESP